MFEFWPESPELLEQRLAKSSPDLNDPYFLPALHEQDRFNWGRFTQASSAEASQSTNPARTPDEGWSPYEQARAVLESCAFEARQAIDVARSVNPSISSLTIVGGCTESEFLVGLIADVAAIQLTVKPDASWPAIGAARIAATGIGWSLPDNYEASVRTVSPSSPNPILNERFETYCRLTSGAPT
jgi:sugar (pentulose or hexulose) kinase